MKLQEQFTVERDPDAVWALFADVPQLARCLPGAELTEEKPDGSYVGTISAKLGPMTATFEGEAVVVSDPANRTGTVTGKGVDRSGGSMGQVKMSFTVADGDVAGTSTVAIDADIILSGTAAQFGRTGLIQEMSRRLIADFAACLEAKIAAETPEEADAVEAATVGGLRLLLSSLWGSFLRRLRGLRAG